MGTPPPPVTAAPHAGRSESVAKLRAPAPDVAAAGNRATVELEVLGVVSIGLVSVLLVNVCVNVAVKSAICCPLPSPLIVPLSARNRVAAATAVRSNKPVGNAVMSYLPVIMLRSRAMNAVSNLLYNAAGLSSPSVSTTG